GMTGSMSGLDTTTTGPACAEDGDCEGDTPLCSPEGTCVSCDALDDPDAACEQADAALPVCSPEGLCVQCTSDKADACTGTTPICGPHSTCLPCTEHHHCPGTACHLDGPDQGACFSEDEVVEAANGSELTAALTGLGSNDDVVIVLAGVQYSTTATISGGAEVAIIGPS